MFPIITEKLVSSLDVFPNCKRIFDRERFELDTHHEVFCLESALPHDIFKCTVVDESC